MPLANGGHGFLQILPFCSCYISSLEFSNFSIFEKYVFKVHKLLQCKKSKKKRTSFILSYHNFISFPFIFNEVLTEC